MPDTLVSILEKEGASFPQLNQELENIDILARMNLSAHNTFAEYAERIFAFFRGVQIGCRAQSQERQENNATYNLGLEIGEQVKQGQYTIQGEGKKLSRDGTRLYFGGVGASVEHVLKQMLLAAENSFSYLIRAVRTAPGISQNDLLHRAFETLVEQNKDIVEKLFYGSDIDALIGETRVSELPELQRNMRLGLLYLFGGRLQEADTHFSEARRLQRESRLSGTLWIRDISNYAPELLAAIKKPFERIKYVYQINQMCVR